MIYLLRHGQTALNAQARYQGRTESPLTARGTAQAMAMAHALQGRVGGGAQVLTSPLGRARQTADLVADHLGLAPPVVLEDLTEVSLGTWEGRTADEIDSAHPGRRKSLPRNAWVFDAPQGEDHATVRARLTRALSTVTTHPAPVRIVVSHAIAGRVLRGIYAGLDPLAALRLEIPQDALFALPGEGRIERIACPEPAATRISSR